MIGIRLELVIGAAYVWKFVNFQLSKAVLSAFVSSTTILAGAPSAAAQQADQSAIAGQSAAIPEGPLSRTLLAISDAFGVDILVPNELVAEKRAPAITEALTIQQALETALAGSGLVYTSTGGAYVLTQQTEPPTATASVKQRQPVLSDVIFVTGQQIDRPLQDTKESVALITAEDIEARSLIDIEDVLLQSANVTFSDPGTTNVTIRGVSRIPFAIGGVGDTSTTFYDDVAITNSAIRFVSNNLWDVQQIEFLRGPQSTNLGRSALIGALIVRTNDPKPDDYEAALRTEIGNLGTSSFEGMVNIPLSSNTALRITGEQSKTDRFLDNITLGTDDDGRREFATVRAKLLTEFSDQFRATASLQYLDGETGTELYVAGLDGPFDTLETRANVPNLRTYEGVLGSLNLEYDVSDNWKLQMISAFSDGDFTQNRDSDATERDGGSNSQLTSQFNWSQELRAAYNGENLRGVAGAYYLNDENDSDGFIETQISPAAVGVPQLLLPFYPSLLLASQNTTFNGETENFALFSQWEYDLTDRLTLSAGLRYDRETVSVISSGQGSLDPATPLPDPAAAGALAEMQQPGLGAIVEGGVTAVNAGISAQLVSFSESTDTTFDALLPEFGLSYDLSPDVRASLFYKRGYRAGGARIELSGALNEFDPEYLENFEFSIRSEFLNDMLVLNANVYYGFWTDQQVNVPIDGSTFNLRTENSGESRIWGIEVEANYRPTDRTQLFASLGYAQTEFTDFCSLSSTEPGLDDCEIDGVAGKDLSGNEFGVSPDWTAALGGQHYLTDRFYTQGNITYQGGGFRDVENRQIFRTDGFWLANASVGYENDTFDVRLYARNLFDQFYETSRANGQQPDEIWVFAGAPREFGVIVSRSF